MAKLIVEEDGYQARLDVITKNLISAREALAHAERVLLLSRSRNKKGRLANELRASTARLKVDLLTAEESKLQRNYDLLGASSFVWFQVQRVIKEDHSTSVRHAYRAVESRNRVLRALFAPKKSSPSASSSK